MAHRALSYIYICMFVCLYKFYYIKAKDRQDETSSWAQGTVPIHYFFLGDTCRMAVWDLSVTVEELGPEAPPLSVSVTSDLHIGGVILKIVEMTRESPNDGKQVLGLSQ